MTSNIGYKIKIIIKIIKWKKKKKQENPINQASKKI